VKNILIVDDNISNILLLSEIIKAISKEKFNIITALNGLQAVEAAKNTPLDLIFMDFKMPVMGGGEASLIIKEEINPDIPIILLTAYLLPEIKNLFKDVHYFNEFLNKPIKLGEIKEVMEKYLS